MFKIVSALLVTMLLLTAFPAMGVDAAHYYTCNRAAFIKDVTVLDGSQIAPGETFTKTWQVRNIGTCTWTKDVYELVYASGENFGITTSVKLKEDVPPRGIVDISIENMVTPSTSGIHYSHWKLSNGSGESFGVGRWGNVALFAKIKVVVPPTPPTVTYDFATNASSATWSSKTGLLPFPSPPSTGNGSVQEDPSFTFEDGNKPTTQGILVIPDSSYAGFIQGDYNAASYHVNPGDRFQTTIGCQAGANCYVSFSLQYRLSLGGPVYTLWPTPYREKNEGRTRKVGISLNSLAGRNVYFILRVENYGYPSSFGAGAIWGDPVIVGTGGPSGISPTGWSNNNMGDFTFDFPSNSVVSNVNKVTLPIIPGTNLNEKYVEVSTKQLAAAGDDCLSSNPGPSAATPVTFNGVEFMKETGGDGGVGNFQEWVSYSAKHPVEPLTCVSLTFILSYSNAGNFDPPRPEFNRAAESAVFDMIMERFKWIIT